MSRDALRNFLHAVEHVRSIRATAAQCRTDEDLIELARRNGFSIQHQDLREDQDASRIGAWFASSRINARRL